MTDLVLGGPVANRDWILPTWFNHVFAACETAHLEPEFVFVVPEWDKKTIWEINDCTGGYVDMIKVDEPPLPDHRNWGPTRVTHLVELRNSLLRRVRQIGPQYFWSLDSDILPRKDALVNALEVFDKRGVDAVGMHLYMSMIGRHHGSKGFLSPGNQLTTRKVEETQLQGVYPTDVVMGSFVARPAAYKIDYQFNKEGEDVGWAIACRDEGLKFMWDARALCKHVMNPANLDKVDERVGF
jgi:hypothetical protein